MCSSGIASAGGLGKALSEWITEGRPTMDLWPVDIKRFSPHENNKQFLRDRVTETLGWHYMFRLPYSETTSARELKCSPLYTTLTSAGAVWGQKLGWERANYFSVEEKGRSFQFCHYAWYSVFSGYPDSGITNKPIRKSLKNDSF